MDLLHLVDRLEELIAGAQKMPIGNRAIVDRRRMLDLIDQMRVAVPEEVREAQEIVANREEIRRDAEEDGRIIIARAEERAARLTEQHEITQAAHRRAEEIAIEAEQSLEMRLDEVNRDIQDRIQESRRIARQQMASADDYAREMLQRLEQQLQTFVGSVQAGIRELEPEPEEEPAPVAALDDEDGRYDFAQYGTEAAAAQPEPLMPDPRAVNIGAPVPADPSPWQPDPRAEDAPPPAEPGAELRAESWRESESEERRPRDLRPAEPYEEQELENLLDRPEVRAVIDDFSNEHLDDDPILYPTKDEDEGRRGET